MRARGHRHVLPLSGPEALARTVASLAESGDVVICLGAGNITQWAYALPGELDAIGEKAA
jgi:UDP-N-acetylmuramate--alanine ligase